MLSACQDFFWFILTEKYDGNNELWNNGLWNPPEDLKNGKRNIKVIRDCGGMQRFSGVKVYEDYNRCQWENIPYERYECQCGPNPNDPVS